MLRCALLAIAIPTLLMAAEEKPTGLDGEYTVTAMTSDGVNAPDEAIKGITGVTFKGDKYTLKMKDDSLTATIKVDAKARPATIDMTPDDGPEKGLQLLGIWKKEKGVLTIAIGKNRPTNFEGKGVEEILIELKEKK